MVNLSVKRKVVSGYRRSQGTRKGSEGVYYQNTLYTYRKLSKLTKEAKTISIESCTWLQITFLKKKGRWNWGSKGKPIRVDMTITNRNDSCQDIWLSLFLPFLPPSTFLPSSPILLFLIYKIFYLWILLILFHDHTIQRSINMQWGSNTLRAHLWVLDWICILNKIIFF